MVKRSSLLPIALAALVVGGAIFWLRKPRAATSDPLAACPKDAFVVGKANVAALRTTALGESVEPLVRALLPIPKNLPEQCGLDPAARLDSIALVVPEQENRNELGIALKLRATEEELSRCAKVLGTGGDSERRGAFAIFKSNDARADTVGAATNGLTILAPRSWALAMIDAANGQAPSAAGAPPHADLLRSLGARSIVLSMALPKATRARVRRELEGAPIDADAGETGSSRRSMEAVLGVEAIAAAVDVATDTEVALELRCENDASCGAVKELIERKRTEWSRNSILRLLGLEPAVSGIATVQSGPRLSVKTRVATGDLRDAIERVLVWRKAAKPGP